MKPTPEQVREWNARLNRRNQNTLGADMSLLTDQEIKDIEMYARSMTEWNLQFARSIEAAVIRKLATVSVDPYASAYIEGKMEPLYTEEALAAALVQAIDECADKACRDGAGCPEATRIYMRKNNE